MAETASDEICLDFGRRDRTGISEALLCTGKSVDQIAATLEQGRARGVPLLLTRLEPSVMFELGHDLRQAIDHDPASRTGIFGPWTPPAGPARTAIVTAGTSDLCVAGEAARTLAFHGHTSDIIADVGVAGLHRLLAREKALRRYPVIIVVAGMDGALFSVLGGLVAGVIIAVPTSTGYGVATGGRVALESALTSCAPGVAVVNIDGGFAGACAALRALNAIDDRAHRQTER